MFTGLVQDRGTVAELERRDGGLRLQVRTALGERLRAGDSIAVSGVCLTAADAGPEQFATDVMAETLRRTALAPLAAGDRVNLELPLRVGDPLGGHIVQGHVDGTATVERVDADGLARVVRLSAPAQITRYVAGKGSVALDGVSLTVVEVDSEGFSVALIPETLERTTLGELGVGDRVNVEVDVLAKYVERLVTER